MQAKRAYDGHLATAYRSEVMYMSDFEILSIFLMVLSLVVVLLKQDK